MDILYVSLAFLVIALVAGFLGFYNIEHAAVDIAKVLFFVFMALFLVSLLMGLSGVKW